MTSRIKKIASPPPVTNNKSFREINELLKKASEMIQSVSLDDQHGQVQANEDIQNALADSQEIESATCPPFDPNSIASILIQEYQIQTTNFFVHFFRYQRDVNSSSSAWDRLSHETDAEILSALLWFWLETLEEPILDRQTLVHVIIKAEKPVDALTKLEEDSRFIVEYLIRFIARLRPDSEELLDLLIRRLIASITHQMIRVSKRTEAEASSSEREEMRQGKKGSRLVPGFRENWPEMRKGTIGRTVTFFKTFYSLLLL